MVSAARGRPRACRRHEDRAREAAPPRPSASKRDRHDRNRDAPATARWRTARMQTGTTSSAPESSVTGISPSMERKGRVVGRSARRDAKRAERNFDGGRAWIVSDGEVRRPRARVASGDRRGRRRKPARATRLARWRRAARRGCGARSRCGSRGNGRRAASLSIRRWGTKRTVSPGSNGAGGRRSGSNRSTSSARPMRCHPPGDASEKCRCTGRRRTPSGRVGAAPRGGERRARVERSGQIQAKPISSTL